MSLPQLFDTQTDATAAQGPTPHANQRSHHAEGNRAPALSPAASAFVPPGGSSTAGAAEGGPQSPSVGTATGAASPVAAAAAGRGSGGRAGGSSKLSRELQGPHSSQAGPKAHPKQGQARSGGRQHDSAALSSTVAALGDAVHPTHVAERPAASRQPQAGEGVLGSSPGRRGVAANHLLSFQSRRDSERLAGGGGRGSGGGRGGGASRGGRGGGGLPRRPAAKPQPYDRNKFLQANFRFLVSDAVDVKRFAADPDLMLEWEDVVQVEMLSDVPVRCPITLEDEPFSPQITPCGHVFSFPAIIGHLVAHGGPELRKSAPCPLCYTQIAARELRLVQVHSVTAPVVGQSATFQLLRRPRDSINPEAVSGGTAVHLRDQQQDGPGPDLACNRFSKFTLVAGAAANALMVAEAGRLAVRAAEVTAEGGLEAAFEAPNIYSAIDALAARARSAAERRQRLLLEGGDAIAQDAVLTPEELGQQAAAAVKGATTAALSAATVRREQQAAAAARDQQFPSLATVAAALPSPPLQPPARPLPRPAAAAAPAQPPHLAAFSEDEMQVQQPAGTAASTQAGRHGHARTAAVPIAAATANQGGGGAEELSSSSRSAGGLLGSSPADGGGGKGGGADFFFFFQAADGQWLFLCPLNLRMLLARYGSYAACPATITAKVLEVEDVTQDESSRRRMRVLAHLPLTATFKLCEIDLTGLLPSEALAPFKDELAQREKRRAQRAKQDARRLKQERSAAAAAAAAAAATGLSAAELLAMPLPSASLAAAGPEADLLPDEGAAASSAALAGEGGGGGDAAAPPPPHPGVSFARMARDGFAATGPSLGSPAAQAPPLELAVAVAAAVGPKGVWGPQPVAAPSVPLWGAAAAAAAAPDAPMADPISSSGRGGKKKEKVVLFGGSQRKY
ncbi:RING finger protein 10 [Chlorella vulgaris]